MSTLKSTSFMPTIKELGDGRPYVLFEPYEKTGIEAFDSGQVRIALVLPEGATQADAADLRDALRVPGLALGIISG
ncbi:hypothetical protein [Nitrospirillum amazonense]|uniref:hypothetical protein n=1 Tax=Nitrospirillum amazonense TaxID=28077 RepID=UPI00241242DA|nr:hypothetical protein [Nitrospirillum amazonense]MDG3444659.1 hypothetical protein [Nitrospirillum amazonense]